MKQLLLLHGALGTKEQWQPTADLLANDFKVHLLTFPGHGGEDINADFSIDLFADAVLQWQQRQGIERLNIVGYSMGGYVGMYLAAHHPHRVEKLVTLATKYEWNTAIAAKETAMLQPDKMEAKVPQFATQLQQRHSPGNWKTVVTKTADMLNRMGEEPPLKPEDFERINAEVLLLLGDRDKMVTLDETVNVMKALPNGQLGVLPATPHPLEGADANLVTLLVKRFLG